MKPVSETGFIVSSPFPSLSRTFLPRSLRFSRRSLSYSPVIGSSVKAGAQRKKLRERTMSHTMREVAKRAGVSPATVSRVLNKTHSISPETERRVLEVVDELNYYKNVHAR